MVWLTLATLIAALHVAAIACGRGTANPPQQVAFLSGLVGLFSVPLLLYTGLKSICIAGACRAGQDLGFLVALVVFVATAITSAVAVAVLAARRSRA